MSLLPPSVHARLDAQFNHMSDSISGLRAALDANRMADIEAAVTTLINRLLDNPVPSDVFVITPLKRQARETFVSLGGIDLLLRFLQRPLGEVDARQMPANMMQRRHELWNEVTLTLTVAITTLTFLLAESRNVA